MALLAFVTFFPQTQHGLDTLRAFLPVDVIDNGDAVVVADADGVDEVAAVVFDVDGVAGPG